MENRNDDRDYVDICIIVPLREEFKRLIARFPVKNETTKGTILAVELETGVPTVKAVAILQDDMGKSAATRAAEFAVSKYNIGVFIVVGIAGGISNDVAVGDVCITGSVIDVLENAKVSDKGGGLSMELSSNFYNTNPRLTFAVTYFSIGKDTISAYEDWQLTQYYAARSLISGDFIGRGSKNEVIGMPELHDGNIVCGSVSKSSIYKSLMKGLDRKVLAVETEAGGVFHVAAMYEIPAIAIRGICDYSDENKNQLETQTGGHLRKIAADNAISLLAAQLGNRVFEIFLNERRQSRMKSTQLQLEADGAQLPQLLDAMRLEAHTQLGHLSPEYRGKPEGYRLPLPRVRASASSATVYAGIRKTDPTDMLEAIARNRITIIEIPRNYPDNSLPWIIAAELGRIELHGKKTAPIVIDGERIKPPSGSIDNVVDARFRDALAKPEIKPIFILDGFPSKSRSRIAALKEEIGKHPDAHFVILEDHGASVAGETDLVIMTGAVRHEICNISFIEIATFIQQNFKIPEQESAVIAYRLHQLFRRFELNAHPSYFAGVAGEVLSSLLKANRRAELLQLAVGGFLSFVVASDTDDVVLSRTTREAFLRALAFEIKVKVRWVDRQSLVSFITEFSERKDYDIDPIKFISAFQEKGIIDFVDGSAKITLPFIESYLLATELRERPEDALRYFDPNNDDFDFNTFDIYAELGADPKVVDNIVSALVSQAGQLNEETNEEHILLTNELRPPYVERQARVQVLKERLQKAFEDVGNNRANSGDKQRLLDIASRVEEEAKEDIELLNAREREGKEDDVKTRDGFRVWAIATTLIGSGSERIDREPKRKLAAGIVQITTVLLDRIMREFPVANFDKLRDKMRSNEVLKAIFNVSPDEQLTPEIQELAET